jgi:hypothetical protein
MSVLHVAEILDHFFGVVAAAAKVQSFQHCHGVRIKD